MPLVNGAIDVGIVEYNRRQVGRVGDGYVEDGVCDDETCSELLKITYHNSYACRAAGDT